MNEMLRLALGHPELMLLAVGLVAAGVTLLDGRRARHPARIARVLLGWYLGCAVGLGSLYAAARYGMSGLAAGVGAAAAPLASQLGAAYLGMSVVGFLAAGGGLGMRLAALLGPAVAIYGTALARLAGVPGVPAVPVDALLVPLAGFALLAWQARAQSHRSVFARSRL